VLWLLPNPRAIGHITLDVHTLLYAAMAIIIGFQAVVFAVFTKVFAISEGLLPEDPQLNKVLHFINLEVGLVVGGVLLLTGLGGSVYALSTWGAHSFGLLDPSKVLRMVHTSERESYQSGSRLSRLLSGYRLTMRKTLEGSKRPKECAPRCSRHTQNRPAP